MEGYQSNGYGSSRSNHAERYGHTNGANGYTNGYGYDDSSTSDRRPGGYGGISSADTASRAPYNDEPRSPDLERRPAQRRSQDMSRNNRSRSRSRPGEGRAAAKIDEIYHYVKRDWSFMTEDKCVPVQVALQLLDPSSLGLARRADDFRDAQYQLQNTLRAVVNEHHQGFSSSLGTFHQIQSSIQSSQQRVGELKASLVRAKTNLSSARPEFTSLAISSRNYARMLEHLHIIEQIQYVPEKLETSISDKRFLMSVDLLQDALKLIRKPEMEDVGALGDTKVYLSNQEHSLTDILTEELHNHLYLKSPYCEERWLSYTKFNNAANHSELSADAEARQIYDFLDQLDTTTPMTDDASRNPEADSFHYIQVIIESLHRLGRLPEAIDSIEERLPVELFKVVERSNNEVQLRHPKALRSDTQKSQTAAADDLSLDQMQSAVLKDLLDTLFAKFEAIAEAHRVFHDVVAGVSRRDGSYSGFDLTRGFKELWKLYQSEMRSLLHDYLSAAGGPTQRSGQSMANEGNIFRQQRDKAKKCNFKMDLVDRQAIELKPSREEVVEIWQKFVPGLVSLSQSDASNSTLLAHGRGDTSAAGHKLLVEPSVFNISSLLPQSVVFLNRLKDIVPPNTDIIIESLSTFLNDFLINVFHPQLEDTITDYCSQSFVQLDAFQQDPQWGQHAQKPVFKGTIKFFDIVTSFCRMLDDLTHDQLFTQLLITQMNTYYDRCSGWYKALVIRSQTEGEGRQSKAAASLADSAEVSAAVDRFRSSELRERNSALDQEISVILSTVAKRPLAESDLISDTKSRHQLCLLYTSMTWVAHKLKDLRKISDRAMDSHGRRDSNMFVIKRSLTSSILERPTDGTQDVYLPLSNESAGFFDGIIDAYHELADLALCTLHLEMRCQVLYRLGSSIKGSYLYTEMVDEADEEILNLSTDLLNFERETRGHLQPTEATFIKDGISKFVDTTLIATVTKNVRSLNAAGSDHLQLNTRVLYHNLLNIEPKADLPRSFAFFRFFDHGAEALLSASRSSRIGLSPEELKALLELQSSEALESEDRESALSAKRQLDQRIAQLPNSISR